MSDQFRELVESIVRDVLATLAPSKPANDEYLTTSAAAVHARVTPGTIRRWVTKKHLTKHISGGRVRVSRAELERYLSGAPANESATDRARRRFGGG